MRLDVLICTLESRSALLARLRSELTAQRTKYGLPVGIVTSCDRGLAAIGAKRQLLLEKSRADYVVFVDDDDRIAPDYLSRIIEALKENPDCIGIQGVMTTDGKSPHLFEHSIRHPHWHTRNGVHYRTPNHLNPVRRTLAIQTGFQPLRVAEDRDYSERLRPLLKTEVFLSGPIYFYDYRRVKG